MNPAENYSKAEIAHLGEEFPLAQENLETSLTTPVVSQSQPKAGVPIAVESDGGYISH